MGGKPKRPALPVHHLTEEEAAAYCDEQSLAIREYRRRDALHSAKVAMRILQEVSPALNDENIGEEELRSIESTLSELLGAEVEKKDEERITRKVRIVFDIIKDDVTEKDQTAFLRQAATLIGYRPPKQAMDRALEAWSRDGRFAAAMDIVASSYGKTRRWLSNYTSRAITQRPRFLDGMDDAPSLVWPDSYNPPKS